MNLKTSETSSRPKSSATEASTTAETFSYWIGKCAIGLVLVARSFKGVCAILIGTSRDELAADLALRFPRAKLVANQPVVHDDLGKAIRFVDKPCNGLHLTLDMRGTLFQRRVWKKLRAIPVGRTVSYMQLARLIGSLASARAVAAACAANPIALAVPCHRVVRTNGDLAGYRWGIERKRELLRKEAMA
jgi:AraC family transcriptional regulator, regulatory protein of adaptative response / methylated-DNA-[protein]-cysteine methyltransferase